ncbi:MAG: aldo/keto reductase [Lentisphaeria bacterium]|nr:aldo/keto reductase [Lentisphaeria bacterium]
MKRRAFLKTGTAVAMGGMLSPALRAQQEKDMTDTTTALPRRPLGRTGESLSVVGMGGIVLMGHSQAEADRCLAEAVERGLNYVDVAPSYGKGEAERKLGPALKPWRDRVFLACKTTRRDKEGAAQELRASLAQIGTDHFDLYQMHAITDVEKDVRRALGPGGAMEAFQEAKQAGLIRFLGFSAHSPEAALAAMDSGLFDTILYPVNVVCHHRGNFDQEVLRRARERGLGVLALKAMARTRRGADAKGAERPYPKCWYEPISDPAEAALALRWTLAQSITAAVPPGDMRLFRIALNVAGKDRAPTVEEERALEQFAASLTPIFSRNA